MDEDISKQITAICLQLLARREYCQEELLDRLKIKGFSRDDSLPVIERLAEQDWQSDSRYAESYARHRINKGFGPIAIAYELNRNGISDVNLDGIVQSVSGSWQAQLEQVYYKKYRDEPLDNAGEWAKRSRFLLQRGFPADMVNALLTGLHGRTSRLGRF